MWLNAQNIKSGELSDFPNPSATFCKILDNEPANYGLVGWYEDKSHFVFLGGTYQFDKIPVDDDKYKNLVGLLFQDIQFQIDPSSYYQPSSDSETRIGSLIRTGTELLIVVESVNHKARPAVILLNNLKDLGTKKECFSKWQVLSNDGTNYKELVSINLGDNN